MTATAPAVTPAAVRPRGGRWQRHAPAALLLAPLMAFMLIFYLIPIGQMVGESLTYWSGDAVEDKATPTLYQYEKTLESSRATGSIVRTFRISLLSVAICFLLSYPIALWLLFAGRKLRTGVLLVVFISLASSLIVRNYGWLVVLADGGPVNNLLIALGLTEFPLRLTYSEGAIITALVHYGMPFMILPIYGSLLRIPSSFWEASQSLGATSMRTLWRVILPLSMPGVFGGTMLVFAVSMSAFVTPLMLGSPSTAMVSQVAAEQLLVQLNFAWGSAIMTTLTVVTLAIVVLYALAVRKVFRVDV
ncbi:ABC transporter permease [Futiania mangrovi]|uniref:ABC transporter permease n=1 Tax=Futiania mangrovi TaxID=2959716 RepID=A0A9J6PD21_9PROT|nr:ABC transporter permease [Futiania mangrovii]MCP1335571.1 ABC transporter permease [Futiania mangrovii]